MGNISDILKIAQLRAKELNLEYEGALFPQEAYEILQSAPGAKLVDVRSQAEWNFVGYVPDSIRVEWATYPGMVRNPNFMAQLEQQVDKESLVIFLCRSGVRSHHAATIATKAGYTDCYNVLEGFEGDANTVKQRNTIGGWKLAGLPWEQG